MKFPRLSFVHRWLPLAALLVMVLGLLAFQKIEPSRQALIETEVSRRLASFAEAKKKRCYKEMLEEATIIVDSILIEKARQIVKIDSVQKPPKAQKPYKPQTPPIDDSLVVEPLIKSDTLLLDTLNPKIY